MFHLIVHWLDDARHFGAYAFAPYNFVTNLSASIIQFAIVVLAVKVLRKRLVAFAERFAHKLVAPHLAAHLEAVKHELKKFA